ncbi:MAG: hypothetical protein AAGA58_19280 [Verrucomicrobiota bacterium]
MKSLERKQIGGILVLHCLTGDGKTHYVEAESHEFRVWKLTRDELIAEEYFKRFCFWSWFIEAIPSHLFLRMATYFMRV